ncbi:hypothetical protein NT08PM_1227 [Pasteurella multocida subsp. multocida str. 3480]|nr:hypothetical protein NT08PM_1227 [Pasteurella multocida subsp. multocida str. 3480]
MGCVHCFLLKVKNGVSLEGIGEKARAHDWLFNKGAVKK